MSTSSSSPSPPKLSPKDSPTRSPSPKRRPPLHERTNSQTNELSAASPIRLVDDLERRIYAASPFPTKPAHILSPDNGPGYVFEEENPVSDSAQFRLDATPSEGQPNTRKDVAVPDDNNNNASQILPASHNDSGSSPSGPNPPQAEQYPSTPVLPRQLQDVVEETEPSLVRPSEDVIVLPNVNPRISIRTVTETPDRSPQPSPPPEDLSSSPNFVTINQSSSSLASSSSRGTTRRHSSRGGHWTSANFPSAERPTSSTDDLSTPRHLDAVLENSAQGDSLPSSSSSVPYGTRSGSSAVGSSSPNFVVHYPVIHPPSSSPRSWAESSSPFTVPKKSSRMNDRGSFRWNPHLSAVPSEWSDERQHDPDGSHTSSLSVEDSTPSSPQLPEPIYLKNKKRATVPTSPLSDEEEMLESGDNLTDLGFPFLRTKNSGFLSIISGESRRTSVASAPERPGSSRSGLTALPGWARTYYAHGGTDSLGAPSSTVSRASSMRQTSSPATDHFPLSIFRPRTPRTPGGGRPLPRRPDSSLETVEPQTAREVFLSRPFRSTIRPPWSPHLHPDRRSAHPRRSTWKAPSLDESAESLLSRRNVQIGLFAAGFLFPLSWLVASFLPLPTRPGDPATNREPARPLTDIERAVNRRINLVDEIRYENARWWRQMNRTLAVVGVVIVVTVITLAVVAST